MSQPRLRPVFTRPLPMAPSDFWTGLSAALARADCPCRGFALTDGAILRLPDRERHVWSPALHLFVEGPAGGPWILHGRFSPSSPVWTGFLAAYLAITILGVGTACWGAAQLILDHPPWALLGIPIALALAGFTYGAALIGQGLGATDMYEMRTFIDRVADAAA
ncbi:MAG: hypothetical protein AB7I19_14060 [Planctomycetota bacterium]